MTLYSYVSVLTLSGFDLVEVGGENVSIRAGKQATRRTLQFAVQALLAVFGKEVWEFGDNSPFKLNSYMSSRQLRLALH